MMYLNIHKHDKNKLAAIDAEEGELTYGDLIKFSEEFYQAIKISELSPSFYQKTLSGSCRICCCLEQ